MRHDHERRSWLRGTLRVAAGCALLPAALPGAAFARAAREGRRLVLIELGGANDGLNTVVPRTDERYRALRPSLALGAADTIDVDAHVRGDGPALHASLAPLVPLLERGEATWVQGLGYPHPNRSHFASIRYWDTGGDGRTGAGEDGWIVHDVEHRLGRPVHDAHGIALDGTVGPFESATGRWLTAPSAAGIAALRARPAPAGTSAHPAVAAMATRMRTVDRTLAALQEKVRRAPPVEPFAGGGLGARLRDVATLVGAGLDVPVYRVRLAGFDTHEYQLARHAGLLDELAQGVRALRDALVASGEWERTLVMTYSEFGRRAAENESGGTDHGVAAPHLLAGGALGGDGASGAPSPFLGTPPDLGALDDTGDPAATLDYRALYERVLSGWFGIPDNRFAGFAADGTLGRLFGAA